MAHWTTAQLWRSNSGRVLPAGELLDTYRADLKGCPSLCCATFTVRAGGESWTREAEAPDTRDNATRFTDTLTANYLHLFAHDPMYRTLRTKFSPTDLAARTVALHLAGTGDGHGKGLRLTCKALGVPYTCAGIRAYLKGATARQSTALVKHMADDPHCTCNDCMDAFTAGEDA